MRIKTLVGALAGLTLVLSACGDDGTDTAIPADSTAVTTTPETTTPETTVPETTVPGTTAPTTGATAVTTVPVTDMTSAPGDIPQRIVSLSPIATEMMYAIGAEDLLVAVDDFSYFPEQALELPHDLSAYEPNVEAIAAYEPELVLLGGDFTGIGDQLASLDIEFWDGPAASTLDDTYVQIEQLGAITGHVGDAAAVVSQMQTDIDAIVAAAPVLDEPLTYYHELGPELYSATSSTFIGQLYDLVGLVNIADPADEDGIGYPQLNAEFVIEADPDLIFLADTKYGDVTATSAAERPGWDQINAVQHGGVVEIDDDIASRWGPRVVDFLRAVVDAVTAVSVDA